MEKQKRRLHKPDREAILRYRCDRIMHDISTVPGYEAPVTPEEAEYMGLFVEKALSEDEARNARYV